MDRRETFSTGGFRKHGSDWGGYPTVFKNYEMNDWHKYWHHDKSGVKVPLKFDCFLDNGKGNCEDCYYPLDMGMYN